MTYQKFIDLHPAEQAEEALQHGCEHKKNMGPPLQRQWLWWTNRAGLISARRDNLHFPDMIRRAIHRALA